MRAARVFACVAFFLGLSGPAYAANPRLEAAAQDALKKAEGEFLAMNYASAATRLDHALKACGVANCTPGTQAALQRDIGTMQFRAGDRGFALKAFAEALKLQPTLDLNPSYDAPDLRAAWVEAKGSMPPPAPAAPPPPPEPPPPPPVAPPPTFPQPTGDFTHAPVAEQKFDTPLPVFIEGGPAGVTHVVVRYKGAEEANETEWNHISLTRMSNGWGGLIPCNAVVLGTLRYFIQAFNKDMDPTGANGDAKNPYRVPVREEIYGQPSHLPGHSPPRACHVAPRPPPPSTPLPTPPAPAPAPLAAPPPEPAAAPAPAPEAGPAPTPAPAEAVAEPKAAPGPAPRIWVGVSFALDLLNIPSGDNLCLLHPSGANGGQPLNDKNLYCVDSSGNDFPTRDPAAGPALNNRLFNGAQAGHSNGATVPATMHLTLAVDYAATDNLLLGGRAGINLGTYPGQAASNDGHAARVPILYLEARATYAFGKKPLATGGLAPIVFLGAGYGEFDGHVSGTAVVPAATAGGAATRVPVDIWATSGPFFGVVGAGIRYAPPRLRMSFSGAARANLVTNGSGLVVSAGPEVTAQYGF